MNKDALDLLREFIDRDVRFLIVGAHAVSFHAEPRTTGDLDLLIDPTSENAQAAYAALEAFGAPLLDLTVADLFTPGMVYQMGVPPYRIDVLTEVTGVSFEEAWEDHELVRIEGLTVPVIGYDALVKNKKAAGRPRDAEDLTLLARHRGRD